MSNIVNDVLSDLYEVYSDPTVTEIRINRPGRMVVERRDRPKEEVAAEALTLPRLELIGRTLSNVNGARFDPNHAPKLSCALPGNHRFEMLVGGSVQSGVSMAIRCKHPFRITPRSRLLAPASAFAPHTPPKGAVSDQDEPPALRYLAEAMLRGRSIIIAGSTNTGKTTVLNELLTVLPEDRRVVAMEDTEELALGRFWDGVGLLAARDEEQQSSRVSWRQLIDHSRRITPDHLIFGEISTQNAFPALDVINSGVTGFMCTIHAESPEQVVDRKFDQNIQWGGHRMEKVPEYLAALVDVVVQVKRGPEWRGISDIYEPGTGRYVFRDGAMVV